ncbi:MAG TPA: hypothetical protein VG937_16680 [Polyangiaceae bacterium]|nr:hypothetical protein [Polyangiaceae bacterium]
MIRIRGNGIGAAELHAFGVGVMSVGMFASSMLHSGVAAAEPDFAYVVNGEGGDAPCIAPVVSGQTHPEDGSPYRPEEYSRGCAEDGYSYTEGGKTFSLKEDADFARHRSPQLLRTEGGVTSAHGNRVLIFDGYASSHSSLSITDRLEVQLNDGGDGDATAFQFNDWRYLRFFIKLQPGFGFDTGTNSIAGPLRDVLVSQVWQRSSNALTGASSARSSVSPAFSINLATAKPTVMDPRAIHQPLDCPANKQCVWAEFRYKNDCNYRTCAGGYTGGGTFHTELIVKDEWVGFIIAMKPSFVPLFPGDSPGRGAILIWRLAPTTAALNDGPSLSETSAVNYPFGEDYYRFYWGYRPETTEAAFVVNKLGLTDRFDVRVGMYRNEYNQGGTFPALYNDTFLMDSIKLTNNQTRLPGLAGY